MTVTAGFTLKKSKLLTLKVKHTATGLVRVQLPAYVTCQEAHDEGARTPGKRCTECPQPVSFPVSVIHQTLT